MEKLCVREFIAFCSRCKLSEYVINLGDCGDVINNATLVADIRATSARIYSNAPNQVGLLFSFGAIKFTNVKHILVEELASYGYIFSIVCGGAAREYTYQILGK